MTEKLILLTGESLVETIDYEGVAFEVISRPQTLWTGKIGYASDLVSEPDIGELLKAYRAVSNTPKRMVSNEGWDVCISIDYWKNGEVQRGMMFAQETLSECQNECYDVYRMPESQFIRVACDAKSAALLGKSECGVWELFGVIKERVMPLYGYKFNENGAQEIEYYNHSKNISYSYIPVEKI
jgi:hypothetical protein